MDEHRNDPAATSSTAELLGLAPDARILLINCDDFGMYHAINAAVLAAIEEGVAASCSLMVPCPWARHAMHLLRERPEIPFGIHLTLFLDTVHYGWGPVLPREEVPSLLNDRGEFFTPAEVPALLERARVEEVEREFRAQIETVLDSGLEPAHLDWHCMSDGGRADLFDMTLALAEEYGTALRVQEERGRRMLAGSGRPVNDHGTLDSYNMPVDGKPEQFAALLASLPPGLSEWAVHPGLGDTEARAIDPGGWRVRRNDYEYLTSPGARETIAESRVVLTDYRALQKAWARASA
jgi:chitin disaccharide deacetylase